MKQYLDLVKTVLEFGEGKQNRTGVKTLDSFGHQIRFDLRKGFPLITTRKLPFNFIVAELLWFISGSTNVNKLREIQHGPGSNKKTIWDANYENQAKDLGYTNGELGPIYSAQWRKEFLKDDVENSRTIKTDQLKESIEQIQKSPDSRRILVNSWNTDDLRKMALPPCHYGYQFNVSSDGQYLDLLWTQRSCDLLVGIPANISSYALLLSIVAQITGKTPRFLIGHLGSVHIYDNHIENAKLQLTREPLELCKLEINKSIRSLDDVEKSTLDDYTLVDYKSHEPLKFEMVV